MTFGEKIIDKLVEDNGNQIKIAFLPYKYSMWDSLETVYDAAVQKGLKTYLMPIKYMTRGDGRWHDETAYFGDNADSTVIFDEIKPDVVVIHNPYDGNNKVTCIDPAFYSDKLKSAGCKIVYLAYCGVCWSEQFVFQNGVKNADYIFTNTEVERMRYIEVLQKHGYDKSNNVFCVGGLPKYEAINKKRDYPVCFEKIKERIVLVAGTLTSFLKNPDVRMQLWKDAVKKYREQNDTFVIFRPHPLMDDTINAMMNQYRLKYDAFLAEIEPDCYIDRSQNFQLAIHIADYLVSDPSSVVDVWKETGKPFEIIE